jgi:lipoprotein-anchoring transpeptidase ErfK/SrfK
MKRLIAYFFLVSLLLFIQNSYADDSYGDDSYPPSANDDYSNAFPEPAAQDNYPRNDDSQDNYPQENYSQENYSQDNDAQDNYPPEHHSRRHYSENRQDESGGELPSSIRSQGEPVIIVNPRVHAWGAYTADGKLLRSGLASAGSSWCEDLGHPCRTKTGSFRISSLGSEDCYSRRFPLGEGGAPMPYCMYFNGGQAIHGSNELAYANISHGCVRVSVDDARWLRYNFSHISTKVIVEPY